MKNVAFTCFLFFCFVMLQETSAAVSWWVVVNFWLVSGLIRSKTWDVLQGF